MRRPGPRPLALALAEASRTAAPATLLARVQGCWSEVAGPALAAEATPVGERSGTLTLSCRSAGWAHELELLAPDLLERLNAALGVASGGPLKGLRVRIGGGS